HSSDHDHGRSNRALPRHLHKHLVDFARMRNRSLVGVRNTQPQYALLALDNHQRSHPVSAVFLKLWRYVQWQCTNLCRRRNIRRILPARDLRNLYRDVLRFYGWTFPCPALGISELDTTMMQL